MKTLTVLLILTVCCTPAFAVEREPVAGNALPVPESTMVERGFNMLELSPIYLEIKAVIEETEKNEQELLRELAQATTDAEVARLIERIKNLAVEREVDILKIQIRYARMDNRFNRERQLKRKLTAVLEACGEQETARTSAQALQ